MPARKPARPTARGHSAAHLEQVRQAQQHGAVALGLERRQRDIARQAAAVRHEGVPGHVDGHRRVAARPARARVAQRAPAGRAARPLRSCRGRGGGARVRQAAEGENGRVVRALLQLAARGRAILCVLQHAWTGLTQFCRYLHKFMYL